MWEGDLEAARFNLEDEFDRSTKRLLDWSVATSRMAILASIPLILIQLPNILQKDPMIPWKVQASGTMGTLSMLAYFTSHRENSGAWIQSCSLLAATTVHANMVVSGRIPIFVTKTIAIASIMGALQCSTPHWLWTIWEDALCVTVTSSMVDIVITSTLPAESSFAPVMITAAITMLFILMARVGMLPSRVPATISAWAATLLCFWSTTLQLVILANGLQLPRALFTRDHLWFGAGILGTLTQGWGFMLSLYLKDEVTDTFFWGTTWTMAIWLSKMLQADAKAHRLASSFEPIFELLSSETPI